MPHATSERTLCIVGADENAHKILSSLATFSNLFQHGGRPLMCITEEDYARFLPPSKIREMFIRGVTYRPGFLLNSNELAGLVHVPPASIFEYRQIPIETLETLPVKNEDLLSGTTIGISTYAGETRPLCIPKKIRFCQSHIIGRPGVGKSTMMEPMVLSDINEGSGVAVLDPHGDFVERLLCLIPEKHVGRVIYLNPGDPGWVPLWNPLHVTPGQDISRIADNLVGSIKSVVTGWGDRLESLLRFSFLALLESTNSTLLDVSDILRKESTEGEMLRRHVRETSENEKIRRFWQTDFNGYRKDELTPPQHKLNKLLTAGTVALTLSQTKNLIDLQRIMNEGDILLVDLSRLGTEVGNILGCFMLSLLHQAALTRSAIPLGQRREFHIFVDESHRYVAGNIEEIVVEIRKYQVSLTLAHQYLSQFPTRKADALASVGSTIVFNVDAKDAQNLKKDFQNKVSVNDLISLERGQAIARIGMEIVRFKTFPPAKIPEKHYRERIIDESHRQYYKPIAEVRAEIRRRGDRWNQSFTPLSGDQEEDFVYDEF